MYDSCQWIVNAEEVGLYILFTYSCQYTKYWPADGDATCLSWQEPPADCQPFCDLVCVQITKYAACTIHFNNFNVKTLNPFEIFWFQKPLMNKLNQFQFAQ